MRRYMTTEIFVALEPRGRIQGSVVHALGAEHFSPPFRKRSSLSQASGVVVYDSDNVVEMELHVLDDELPTPHKAEANGTVDSSVSCYSRTCVSDSLGGREDLHRMNNHRKSTLTNCYVYVLRLCARSRRQLVCGDGKRSHLTLKETPAWRERA